ncbi:Membrane protein involved in the export of O-antigen and teichoic acid [Noviherbaspirillum humi]|uniref:Membrane protein involved in the export of O-antigen and teichoic acid n=1 Tax=Noviherbaspirillum humi TaxID=1688639 RepID=A0A239HLM2_9BURK|nr:oligosaccharide flippase family protein [Noviherbaspirillum humi]SNS81743.1 Membrane protein involved in the export of O-antigen and teichoic acid [Noviherbaspirillum humi]
MTNLRRSLIINFFSSSGAALMQFFVSVALARMLSPREIGVFSMTAVFVTVAHMFRDFGVANYIQREPNLTSDKIRSAIGVMYTTSWSLALIMFLTSPLLATWFHEPGMVPVMRVLALGFVIVPFGSLTHSMLIRELAADKQAYVTAAGTISYCVSCLILAAFGFGTMSLAWANLINICTCALAYVPLRPKEMPWLPSLRHWREVVHFGIGSMMTNCVDAINGVIPDTLLGKLGGAHHVGLFSRANSTVSIFNYAAGNTITYGAVSYLSQAHHRGDSLVPVLRRATRLLTGIGWPAFALSAVLARDLVVTLYGPNWADSAPAVAPLAMAAAITMLFQYTPSGLTAVGRPYLGALPLTAVLFSRIAFGYLLYDGSLVGFGWAVCLATAASGPVQIYLQSRYLNFSLRDLCSAITPSVVVTFICLLTGKTFQLLLPQTTPAIVRLLLIGPPMVAVWYVALHIAGHELAGEVNQLARGFKTRLGRLVRLT